MRYVNTGSLTITDAPLLDEALPVEETFDAFFLREYPKMVALAAAVTRRRTAAEDVAQEAMIRAHRRWDTVGGYDKPGAWVRRVTINLASSELRRRAAEAKRLIRLQARASSLPPADEGDTDVWSAVAQLPRKQRAAVALFYLEDRPVREIAEILDCAEATAKVHLHRGRAALADALGERRPS